VAVQDRTLSSDLQLEVNECVDLFQDAKGAFFDKDYQTAIGLAGETIDFCEELLSRLGAPPVPEPTPEPTPEPQPIPDTGNKCPKCGMSVKPNWDMCPMCESPLKKKEEAPTAAPTCPSCGKPVKERWSMCPFCEASLK